MSRFDNIIKVASSHMHEMISNIMLKINKTHLYHHTYCIELTFWHLL